MTRKQLYIILAVLVLLSGVANRCLAQCGIKEPNPKAMDVEGVSGLWMPLREATCVIGSHKIDLPAAYKQIEKDRVKYLSLRHRMAEGERAYNIAEAEIIHQQAAITELESALKDIDSWHTRAAIWFVGGLVLGVAGTAITVAAVK